MSSYESSDFLDLDRQPEYLLANTEATLAGGEGLGDAVTADSDIQDLPDDLPDAYRFEGDYDPVEHIAEVLGEGNPYEGLDDWMENFDLATLPASLSSDEWNHFHVSLDTGEPNPTNWCEVLKEGYAQTQDPFMGDIAQAGECMTAFERGMRFVFERFSEKGVVLEFPPIRIVTDPLIPDGEPAMAATAYELLVNGPALEEASIMPKDEVQTFPPPESDEPPGMVGTMEEVYLITGVEEAHHNIHERLMEPEPPHVRGLSHIEYHAQEREFHALRWKIVAAKAFGMSDVMIDALQSVYDGAKDLRRAARKAA